MNNKEETNIDKELESLNEELSMIFTIEDYKERTKELDKYKVKYSKFIDKVNNLIDE